MVQVDVILIFLLFKPLINTVVYSESLTNPEGIEICKCVNMIEGAIILANIYNFSNEISISESTSLFHKLMLVLFDG